MEQLPEWVLAMRAFDWEGALQLILAAVLGGTIGAEREWNGHDAGFRTNILVATGACLFTIMSITGFPLVGAAQDTGRVAAQIVSGIGFLGAGSLLQTRNRVRGLTTAATVWLVAAIGMAVGAGAFFLATFCTFMTLGVLRILRPISDRLSSQIVPLLDEPDEG